MLLIAFVWPLIIYVGTLYLTRLLKFDSKERRSIAVEVIIANLLSGKWVSAFIIWKSSNIVSDQLYPAMFGMTFVILTGHWILIHGQKWLVTLFMF